MNWFRNAKFQKKFLLAFGVLLSFVVILAVSAIMTISRVEMAFIRLAEGPNKRLASASDIVAELANCRRCIISMSYMAGNDNYVNAYYASYQESADLILEYMDEYSANFMNDAFLSESEKDRRKTLILDLRERFVNEYQPSVTDLYAAAMALDRQEIDELVEVGLPLGDEMTDTLRRFQTTVQTHVNDITAQTRAEADRAIRLLVVSSIFLTIFSVLISIRMSAALKAPIEKMEASMAEIAKGNLSYPIRSDCKDELGVLSNHIGDMVETISMLNKAVAIIDNVDELIFVTDLEYNIIYVNQKVEELFGYDRDTCIGQKCYKLMGDGTGELCSFCPLAELLEKKNSFPFRDWERHMTINEKDSWFSCKMSIIQWVDGSLVQISTCKDDTLRKRHEEQQTIHEEELRKAALIAEEASRAKSTFLASMSHEIRTPMNAVMGMSELILRKELPQDVYENALGIKSASQNLLSIINDILDFSKIESGMLEIVESDYDFSVLINDIIGIIRIRLMENPIQFIADIDPRLPSALIGDEVRMRQIFINLLGNAVKYTNEGYISLKIAGEIIDESVTFKIDISDTGIGIKPENIEKLFGDFVQFDMAKNKGIEGTGLGLAITRKLCQTMGGAISVQSEYGKGSTFTVTLPQRFTEYHPLASVYRPESKSVLLYETRERYRDSIILALKDLNIAYKASENISSLFEDLEKYSHLFISSFMYGSISPALLKISNPPKLVILSELSESFAPKNARILTLPAYSLSIADILNDVREDYSAATSTGSGFIAPDANVLIVDDITSNLKVAEGLMSSYEMQITLCSSGREAVKLVRDNRYDIVFMDHMMPEMDGLEATRRIREIGGEYFASLPIIALTANAISGVREMFIQNGMNDFLSKPIEMVKLNAILEKWIPKNKKKKVQSSDQPAEKSAFVEMLKDIRWLSVDKALAVMGGSPKSYEHIVKLSVRLLPENITKLNDLIHTDLPYYAIEVHGIKGVLNNIGAYSLGKTAFKLEELSKGGDIEACKSIHPNFVSELIKFHDSISALMSESNSAEKPAGDNALLLEALSRLEDAVNAFDDALAVEILSSVNKNTYGQPADKVLEDLAKAFECFDFDTAAEQIESLKGELEAHV